jgi:hypothetical protein
VASGERGWWRGGGLDPSPRLTWRLRIGNIWLIQIRSFGRSPFRVLSHKFWPARNALWPRK